MLDDKNRVIITPRDRTEAAAASGHYALCADVIESLYGTEPLSADDLSDAIEGVMSTMSPKDAIRYEGIVFAEAKKIFGMNNLN